jgi:hypothetical protein
LQGFIPLVKGLGAMEVCEPFVSLSCTNLTSYDPLFSVDTRILGKLCQDVDIHDLDAFPVFGCYQGGLFFHERGPNGTCE